MLKHYFLIANHYLYCHDKNYIDLAASIIIVDFEK